MNMKNTKRILTTLSSVFFGMSAIFADNLPRAISFQGRFIENGVPATGTKNITFRIFSAETGTPAGEPLFTEIKNGVPLGPGGVFQVLIGSNTLPAGIPVGIFNGDPRWVEVVIGGTPPETLAPRAQLVSVPYAYHADFAQNATTATFSINSGTATFATTAGTASFVAGGGAIPIGGILPYAGAMAPLGFFLCDGTVRPMADSPALGALLLGTYGGDGTSTFGVPDLRGRFPLGVSATDALASTGGARTHTLSTAEMPSHSHGVSVSQHRHDEIDERSGFGTEFNNPSNRAMDTLTSNPAKKTDFYNQPASVSVSILAEGGGQPHNNMSPYQAVNYIIKH